MAIAVAASAALWFTFRLRRGRSLARSGFQRLRRLRLLRRLRTRRALLGTLLRAAFAGRPRLLRAAFALARRLS